MVTAIQAVLLALITAFVARGTHEQKKLNGHAAKLLAERVIRERDEA